MNGPVQATISQSDPCTLMPAFLKAIARPLSLLPGEDPEEFEAIRDVIIDDVAPQSGIEWLWTIDLIELSWDIQRYRTLRHKVLETHRQRAIEQALLRIDCAGIPAASQEMALSQIQQNAARWQDDPQAAIEIKARLASYGFDTFSIDMEVLVLRGSLGPKSDALVMHPGPMNRGVEIDSIVADGAQSLIREQVEMGR
jgi:hypothetical protein